MTAVPSTGPGNEQTAAVERHCSTCICGRRAPVQGQRWRPATTTEPERAGGGAGTIAWEEHLDAYSGYSARFGSSQSAERLAERGGFGYDELLLFLGHEPTTWTPR